MNRKLKLKLLRAKRTLSQTIQNILEINRHRKGLSSQKEYPEMEASMDEELKVLNKIAAQQARLISHYESALNIDPRSRRMVEETHSGFNHSR